MVYFRYFLRNTVHINILVYCAVQKKCMSMISSDKTYPVQTHTHPHIHLRTHTHWILTLPVKNSIAGISLSILVLFAAHCVRRGSHLCELSTRPMPTKTSNEDAIIFWNHVLHFHIYILHELCRETNPICNLVDVQICI